MTSQRSTSTRNLYPDLLAAAEESIQASTEVLPTRTTRATRTRQTTSTPRPPRARKASKNAVAVAVAAVTTNDNMEETKMGTLLDNNNEDDVRTPDPIQRARLLDFPTHDEDQRLLQEAMDASRREFQEHIERLELERRQRIDLRNQFALAISRLGLWRRTSSSRQEMLFIDYIIDRFRYITRSPEEEDILIEPPPMAISLASDYQAFLTTLSQSSTYKDLVSSRIISDE